ncbi:DNA cytosine methyltransferase [uncultured Stenotrophomonas sp.]|uniref:DNA cytosine methyltransferase n=1 Tax=uncultured Stenotrophomonas sp. TaxID=165438 RepID=UPI0028EB6377|nr:DNA cytosine methyltransferase [uncultured Stenotrophomonas sp.]
MNYYSEWDPFVAQWLRNLIDARLIPAGHVDTRSITDVQPDDLAGYRQCHFFAGIGGWPLAARLAGWPDDREIWSGSPPCQPFSLAGQGKAQADDRHLWPHVFRLVRARRPALFVGEQVAAAVGRDWIDGVLTDLEGIGYAGRALVIPACAVDAPHRRDRLWTLAHTDNPGPQGFAGNVVCPAEGRGEPAGSVAAAGVLAAAEPPVVANADRGGLAPRLHAASPAGHRDPAVAGHRSSSWAASIRVAGHDDKGRRIEPSIPLLAHGLSGRVAALRPGFEPGTQDPEAFHWYSRTGALKAFGNAIVPQVAAEVIGAYMDCYPTSAPTN